MAAAFLPTSHRPARRRSARAASAAPLTATQRPPAASSRYAGPPLGVRSRAEKVLEEARTGGGLSGNAPAAGAMRPGVVALALWPVLRVAAGQVPTLPTITNKTFIEDCVHIHNELRAKVQPAASNMRYMVGRGLGMHRGLWNPTQGARGPLVVPGGGQQGGIATLCSNIFTLI